MGYVGEVKIGNDTHLVGSTLYGTCGSAANAAEKSVTCANFSNLMNNITIHVKFTNTNTATNPTLNVNGTGAKRIYRYGTTAPGNSTITSWNAGSVVSFTYDGSSWMMNDAFDGQQLKTDLQNSFQAGVDSVYDAVVAEGSTPASKSLSDVVAGIHAIPNKNTETFPATTREAAKDMGYNNKYRYVNTNNVPNSNSGTWGTTITSNGTKDLGSSFSYRYVKVQVPNTCTSTYNFPVNDTGGTKDLGAANDTRYVNASNVYNKGKADGVTVHTETYTFPANDTGGTKDLGSSHSYRYVNADNVYNKGKSDGQPTMLRQTFQLTTIENNGYQASGWSGYTGYQAFLVSADNIVGNNNKNGFKLDYAMDMTNGWHRLVISSSDTPGVIFKSNDGPWVEVLLIKVNT